MKKTVTVIFSIFIVLCNIFGGGRKVSANVVYAEKPDPAARVSRQIDRILEFSVQDDGPDDIGSWISEVLSSSIGGTAEWYIIGLAQYPGFSKGEKGSIDKALRTYHRALTGYLSGNEVKSATARLKFALALAASGNERELAVISDNTGDPPGNGKSGNVSDNRDGNDLAGNYIGKCLSDGTVGGLGVMSLVFGLHVVNNGYVYTDGISDSCLLQESQYNQWQASRLILVDSILSRQHKDGGWSVMGDYGDVDVTAMVLQALAPVVYRNDRAKTYKEDEKYIKAVERGLAFLSEKMLDDGTYMSFGTKNAESTAQVLTALSALGIDCTKDERFIRNSVTLLDGITGFELEDGSFAHEPQGPYSANATVQTFYSLVAYSRMLNGMSSLYLLDSCSMRLRALKDTVNDIPGEIGEGTREGSESDNGAAEKGDAGDNGDGGNEEEDGRSINPGESGDGGNEEEAGGSINPGDNGDSGNEEVQGENINSGESSDGGKKQEAGENIDAGESGDRDKERENDPDAGKNLITDKNSDQPPDNDQSESSDTTEAADHESPDNITDLGGRASDEPDDKAEDPARNPQDKGNDSTAENKKNEETAGFDEPGKNGKRSYKFYGILVIIASALLTCIILFLRKKHKKNYLFVAIAAAAGILIVIFTDFKTASDYYSGNAITKEKTVGTVTMSIKCDILCGKTDLEYVPQDGIILKETEFEITDSETVYDILIEAARRYGISVDHKGGSNIVYISGINYLYEQDYGELSGWVYKVNGQLPSVGCASYDLTDGDRIEWCYTLDLGNDSLRD